jgi:cysteine desulfurase family protein (TIGR01976 family)
LVVSIQRLRKKKGKDKVKTTLKEEAATVNFPIQPVRASFPALNRGDGFVFFDNAAGAQVPQAVLDAVNKHLLVNNVQRGGRYPKSQEVDAVIARARASVASLLNARHSSEIAFGMNATSFIRLISLAIGQRLEDRNEIVVTDMDHEANIATWLALPNARFVWWKMRDDGNLHVEDLQKIASPRTRLVACTAASNALGSVVDVAGAARVAHQSGAEIFLDCVHYIPHGVIDVQAFDCDYLVCSGYKMFTPHMGFLWGRLELLQRLPTFREDFIPDEPPGKIEAGTFIYENVAGMDAAVNYLEWLGQSVHPTANAASLNSRRERLLHAMDAVQAYEKALSLEIIQVLSEVGATIYGIRDVTRLSERVPTFGFNLPNVRPARVTEALAESGIGVRDGHMYAPRLMKRLGVDIDSGVVRLSLVHYNTLEEVQRLQEALVQLRRHG